MIYPEDVFKWCFATFFLLVLVLTVIFMGYALYGFITCGDICDALNM